MRSSRLAVVIVCGLAYDAFGTDYIPIVVLDQAREAQHARLADVERQTVEASHVRPHLCTLLGAGCHSLFRERLEMRNKQ